MITLINPPGIKLSSGLQMQTPNPPLGLAYVAAAVKEADLSYRVIDGTGEALDTIRTYPGRGDFMVQGYSPEEIVERVPQETKIVGMSCLFSTLWPLTRIVAEAIRRRFPDALMVLGSEHGTAVPEHALRNSPFDVVVLGEGEETFVSLCRAAQEGRALGGVPGLAFLEDGRFMNTGLSPRLRRVDDIPLPDWDAFPIEEYISRHQINGANMGRSIPLLATRGCPYECTFCSNPNMWTRRYIARDPRLVVDEMELYIRKYDVVNFDFQDLTAIVKRSWAIQFCRELIRRRLDITWQMPSGTRCEVFDEEVADLLYRSGCRALAFAPESGDAAMLKKVKKQVDLVRLVEAAKVAVKRGLKLSCFIVIGFPDETPRTMRKTMKLIRRLALLGADDVAVAKFVPYPGSELFKRLQTEGKVRLDDEFFVSPMDFYTEKSSSYADAVSSRRLYWTMVWMFVNFYVISFVRWPWRVLRTLGRAVFGGVEETRYAKWFVDRYYTRRHWRRSIREAPPASPQSETVTTTGLARPLRSPADLP